MDSSTRGTKTKILTKIHQKLCDASVWSVADYKKSSVTFNYISIEIVLLFFN